MGKFTQRVVRRTPREEVMEPFVDAPCGDPAGQSLTYVNNLYQVSVDERDGGMHLSIVRLDRSAIHDWRHLQQIKNMIAGPEREACEIYPAESRLVDTNNQFHLWVFPEGQFLPIGYTERQVTERTWGAHRQRPFPPGTEMTAEPLTTTTKIMFPWLEEKEDNDEDHNG